MSTNPERPIERLLRQAAEKRRADAGEPAPLHPATRRLLQGEVTRQYPQARPEPKPAPSGWLQFWPRLAWTTALAAVMGSFLWLGLHRDTPPPGQDMAARKSDSPRMEEAIDLAPTAAPPRGQAVETAPVGTVLADSATGIPPAGSASRPTVAAPAPRENLPEPAEKPGDSALLARRAAPAPAPTQAETLRLGADKFKAMEGEGLAREAEARRETKDGALTSGAALAEAGAARSAPAGGAGVPPARSLETAALPSAIPAAPAAQRFSNALAATQEKQAAAKGFEVLNTFAVEQNGPALRIVDADGSEYVGQVEPQAVLEAGGVAVPEPPAEAARSRRFGVPAAGQPLARAESQALPAEAVQNVAFNYNFKVTGTNRSLNEKVEFAGNLLAIEEVAVADPAPGGQRGAGTAGLGGQAGALDSLTVSRQQNRYGVDASNQSRQLFQNQAQVGKAYNTFSNAQAGQFKLYKNLDQNAPPDLQRARINGRAVVGGKQQLEVDALPQPQSK